MSRIARTRSYYGVTIARIDPAGIDHRGEDSRVFWLDENRMMQSAPMRPSVNTEKVLAGDVADVIRNGNGRVLALRRTELRKYQVEVLMEVALPGDEDAAYAAVDQIMQANWDRTQGGTTIGGPNWHFTMLEGCVADITGEDR